MEWFWNLESETKADDCQVFIYLRVTEWCIHLNLVSGGERGVQNFKGDNYTKIEEDDAARKEMRR